MKEQLSKRKIAFYVIIISLLFLSFGLFQYDKLVEKGYNSPLMVTLIFITFIIFGIIFAVINWDRRLLNPEYRYKEPDKQMISDHLDDFMEKYKK